MTSPADGRRRAFACNSSVICSAAWRSAERFHGTLGCLDGTMGRMGHMGRMDGTMGCIFCTFYFYCPIVLFIRPMRSIRPMQLPRIRHSAPSHYRRLTHYVCIHYCFTYNFLWTGTRMDTNGLNGKNGLIFHGQNGHALKKKSAFPIRLGECKSPDWRRYLLPHRNASVLVKRFILSIKRKVHPVHISPFCPFVFLSI